MSPHPPADRPSADSSGPNRRRTRRTRRAADRFRRARAAVGASLRDFVDSLAPVPDLVPIPVRIPTAEGPRRGGAR